MHILCLNWKDVKHPQGGGAEVVTEQLLRRLAADGHQVTLLTSAFPNALSHEVRDGYTIIRRGGRMSVYWYAYRYYRSNLRGNVDLIIEEVNTIPFFTRFYAREPIVIFIHQLARTIWFYEMPWPLAMIGYMLEPLYLRILSKFPTITVSSSTKADLRRFGFRRVCIISEGIDMTPLTMLDKSLKAPQPTLLSLGALRSMKRTHHIIEAFELAKKLIPDLRLIIAGATSGSYGKQVLARIQHSPLRDAIEYLGPVDGATRLQLMQQAHLLAVTSVKEGWCLVVTEANSQGTPAVVYDVDGLRDSVKHAHTGFITSHNTPVALAKSIVALIKTPAQYQDIQHAAWEWSKSITFDRSYHDLLDCLKRYGY
jgi:glycosyltransferase involved in cell wall biosynthesis